MAESELGVLSFQCLDRRIPDQQLLKEEVDAWEADRNKKHAKADWRFTTENARVKLKRLYPHYERLGRLGASTLSDGALAQAGDHGFERRYSVA